MISLYLGNEPYTINSAKNKILGSLNCKEMNSITVEEFGVRERDFAEQAPFLDDKRIVILHLDTLEQSNDLERYMANPSDSTDIIITADKIIKTSSFYKKLKKDNLITEFNKISDQHLKIFILKTIKEGGGNITENGFNALHDRLSYHSNDNMNLYTVENTVKQLLHVTDCITKEVVESHIEKSIEENSFAVAKYLFEKDTQNLFDLLRVLREEKIDSIALLGALLRTFRIAYKARLCSGMSKQEIASELGVTAFQIKTYDDVSIQVLKDGVLLITEAINDIKTGMNSYQVVHFTIAKLLNTI